MHNNGIKQFLLTGKGNVFNKTLELAALRKDNMEFPMELRISYTRSKDEYVFIAFISDITERKKAETQLMQKLSLGKLSMQRARAKQRVKHAKLLAAKV